VRTLEKPAVQRRGVLLSQHFELRDRYLETLGDDWLAALSPFGWGFAELDVDVAALAEGIFRVRSLTARFPSGEIAVLRPGEVPLQIALPPEALADRPLDVFLGLADFAGDGPNVSGDGEHEGHGGHESATRYRSIPAEPEGRGPVLAPKLRLYLERLDELPADRMRLARVRTTRIGIEVDSDVLPPMLWPLEGTSLPGALAAVARALTSRQAQLLAQRQERPHEPTTFTAEQTPALLALSALQQALAALSNPVSRRGTHPRESHRILAELLGSVEALEATIAPLPAYVHESPGPGFRVLVDRLLAAIPVLARAPHEILAFTRRDAHAFELTGVEPALLRRRVHLVLIGGERGSLEQNVPAYAKLASDAWMGRIVQTAVRGIELAPDFDPPASLPSSAHSACFRLNTRSEYWADVLERGAMVFFLPNAPADLRVALYVMNEGERGQAGQTG
jgi:type VI secretion system protein ImpJ